MDSLDRTIAVILELRGPKHNQALGDVVRNVFGRRVLSQFTDAEIGDALTVAALDLLVFRRADLITPFVDLVAFPDMPHGPARHVTTSAPEGAALKEKDTPCRP